MPELVLSLTCHPCLLLIRPISYQDTSTPNIICWCYVCIRLGEDCFCYSEYEYGRGAVFENMTVAFICLVRLPCFSKRWQFVDKRG